jgi:hypothetical protein
LRDRQSDKSGKDLTERFRDRIYPTLKRTAQERENLGAARGGGREKQREKQRERGRERNREKHREREEERERNTERETETERKKRREIVLQGLFCRDRLQEKTK